MVRRSHTAIDMRTVLVGELMMCWLNTIIMMVLDIKVTIIRNGIT